MHFGIGWHWCCTQNMFQQLHSPALCGGYSIIFAVYVTYLLSNLLSGLYSSSCDIGYASLGAIKTALCAVGAIIRRRSYLHTVSSSICIRPSLSIVRLCLFVCNNVYGQAMYQAWSKDGRAQTSDKKQKFKRRRSALHPQGNPEHWQIYNTGPPQAGSVHLQENPED